MVNDVFYTVRNSQSCSKAPGTLTTRQKHLHLFPTNGPRELVVMEILGPVPKPKSGKRFILVITDLYSKLTSALPIHGTTTPLLSSCFLNNWVFPYGIPQSVLTDNGPKFIAQLFRFVCPVFGLKLIAITAYHHQSNGQTEQYKKFIVALLRHCVSDHQNDSGI